METQFNTLEEAGVNVISSITTPSRPGKKPRPVFIVAGKTEGLDETFRDLGGKKFRGQWSFWSDPSDALLKAINRYGRLSFSEQIEVKVERKLERAARYEGYAENAEARSEARSKAAGDIAHFIPMGQPILVGHHSEGRHRRDLDRINSHMRKSIEESKKVDYFSGRADNLEHDAKRIKQDRSYIANRIEEAEAYLRRLQAHAAQYSDFEQRVAATTEKLNYWKEQLATIEATLIAAGRRIACPENIKRGSFVNYGAQWYEVIRVSKKTVTIKNWLDVPTFTYKLRYADLSDYRDPKAEQAQLTEQTKAAPTTDQQQLGGAQ
jgi:hypothetical protein